MFLLISMCVCVCISYVFLQADVYMLTNTNVLISELLKAFPLESCIPEFFLLCFGKISSLSCCYKAIGSRWGCWHPSWNGNSLFCSSLPLATHHTIASDRRTCCGFVIVNWMTDFCERTLMTFPPKRNQTNGCWCGGPVGPIRLSKDNMRWNVWFSWSLTRL